MKYRADQGGHVSGHLREAFVMLLDLGKSEEVLYLDDIVDRGEFIYDREETSARWIIGQVWNCTDFMPGPACADLDLPQGSTYAQGARRLKERMEVETQQ